MQFLQKDPAKADGEESAYQYCGGEPSGRTDPTGLGFKHKDQPWMGAFEFDYYTDNDGYVQAHFFLYGDAKWYYNSSNKQLYLDIHFNYDVQDSDGQFQVSAIAYCKIHRATTGKDQQVYQGVRHLAIGAKDASCDWSTKKYSADWIRNYTLQLGWLAQSSDYGSQMATHSEGPFNNPWGTKR